MNIGDILVVQYTAAGIFQGEISLQGSWWWVWIQFRLAPATGIVLTQTIDCLPARPPEDCEVA